MERGKDGEEEGEGEEEGNGVGDEKPSYCSNWRGRRPLMVVPGEAESIINFHPPCFHLPSFLNYFF